MILNETKENGRNKWEKNKSYRYACIVKDTYYFSYLSLDAAAEF